MKIQYRREMRRNYMIIDPEQEEEPGYEGRMLSGNAIDGVLRLQIRPMESGVRFYYDITSKQPLSRLLQGMRWKSEQILQLMQGIFSALERLEGYLLNESCIYLDPDYIYLSPESFRVWLCVIPGFSGDFREMFGRLLEKLLEHVDHEDKPSVILAYGIYQATRREDYGIEDIRRAVREELGKERDHAGEQGSTGENSSESELSYGKLADIALTAGVENHAGAELLPEKEGKKSFFSGLSNRFHGFFRREKKPDAGQAEESWQRLFAAEESGKQVQEPQPEEEPPVQLTAQKMDEEDAVIIGTLEDSAYASHILRSVTRETEDIPVTYYPFIIGKQGNLVDYCLDHETVSRLHVKLDRRENRFFVQDLNSTNGTLINGRLLENNEEAEIFVGDELCIARFRYRLD